MNNKLILYSLSGHLTPSNITWKLTTLPRHKIHHLVTAHTSHLIFWTLVHYQILHYNVGEMDKIHHTNQSVTDITDWHSICHLAFFSSSSEWLEKASRTSSHLLAGHYEELPIIPQPQCGRCHQAGTGHWTLDRPLWRLLAASRAMHWNGASRTMMMIFIITVYVIIYSHKWITQWLCEWMYQ